MRVTSLPILAAISLALWAGTGGIGSAQAPQKAPAAAPAPSAAPAPAKPLTDAQVTGFLAAQKDLDAIPENEPEASARAKQDAIAKKNGFSDGADLDQVEGSIEAVLAGIDETGKYVGPQTLIKRQIDEVKADKKMPAKDRTAALKELNQALAEPMPAPPPGDVDVVVRHFKEIQAAMPQGDDKP